MANAVKSVVRKIGHRKPEYFAATKALFNQVAEFYFGVIHGHIHLLQLNSKDALTEMERLTVKTKENPSPPVPLPFQYIPAMLRRACINAAYGSAKSFFSSLERHKEKKAKAEARGKKHKQRPPVPPREWNRNVVFYAGMLKGMDGDTVMLKLYTGKTWVWLKFKHAGRAFPDGWKICSPSAVIHKGRIELHFPAKKKVKLVSIKKQLKHNPDLRVCAVDLNLDRNHAVCVIQSSDGTQGKVGFIRGNKALHGRRKRLLGTIAVKRSEHGGVLKKEESDNILRWEKIRNTEDHEAHRVSRRIVGFALKNGASVIVFENLKSLKPVKGRYSRRSNTKRAYWLKGRIREFTRYKAMEHGILVSMVNPRDTSRKCFYCDEQVYRYGPNEVPAGYRVGAPLFLCPNGHRGNADVNAGRNIGKKFFLKHLKPGKKLPGAVAFHDAPGHDCGGGPVALPGSSVGHCGSNEVAATLQILRDTSTHGLA